MDELASITSLIIDMDGVLYHEDKAMPGAKEFLGLLQSQGTPFMLLTNNSTRTVEQYVTKLNRMGIKADESMILTSGQATALYLEKTAPPGTKVYIIGEQGLWAEIAKRGYQISDSEADLVVVGMDTQLTYEKLKVATLAIRRGAKFIGTNPDKTFPAEEGIIPGTGAILAALEASTGIAPLVIGKPEPVLFETALAKMSADQKDTAVIGDRLETDILGGINAGLITILLLSGVTSRQEMERSAIKPDFVFEDLAHLLAAWQKR